MAHKRSSVALRPRLVLLCGSLLLPVARVEAQTTLAPADSAQVRVATLRALDAWLHQPRPLGRLWVRGERQADGTWRAVSPNVLAGIRGTFPLATPVDPDEDLFECPSGRRVEMPGRGCPIMDRGRIVVFWPITVLEDGTVRTGLGLTYAEPSGRWTAMADITVIVAKSGESWAVTRVLSRGVT